MSDINHLLDTLQEGDPVAGDQLLVLVYSELRRLAAAKMSREAPGQTLQPTALVHEAWLRLGGDGQRWENRAHFFGAAAAAMRRILIDRARRKLAARHGGGAEHVDVDEIEIGAPGKDEELLAVHEALDRLAAHDAPKAELVKLRYFAGLTIDETAEVLGISPPNAKRWWAFARAWLFNTINPHGIWGRVAQPKCQSVARKILLFTNSLSLSDIHALARHSDTHNVRFAHGAMELCRGPASVALRL